MTVNEQSDKPATESIDLEGYEFVTLAGHEYVCVTLEESGWKREQGFLERRQRDVPVAVDRRRSARAG